MVGSHDETALLERLQRRLDSEKMIGEVSLAFIRIPKYEEAFAEACRLLGEATRVSRVYIFENFDSNKSCCNTVEWVAPGVEAVRDKLQDVPYDSIPYWGITLERGEAIRADAISTLPRDVHEILEWQNIKSILVVPLNVLGHWHGFLGFDACAAPRQWCDDDVAVLQTAARIICAAMERRQLERELAHSGRLSAVGTLAAGVAHEYNNLHAGILGLVELSLESDQLPAAVRSDLMRVLALIKRGSALTRKLLDLSRRRPQQFLPVDFAAVVRDCVALLERSLRSENVEVLIDDRTDRSWVLGDASELGQVALNIVLNAVEAMQAQPRRRVSVSLWNTPQRQLTASFEDTGPGVPPDLLPLIFDPFFTTKGKLGGGAKESTGLGLAISRQIIRHHGGALTAGNRPGGGASFVMTLPTVDPPAAATVAGPPIALSTPRRTGRIGVLDDEQDILLFLRRALAGAGHHVEVFDSADEATAALAQRRFDVFLVDLVMPPPDGAEFIRRVNARPREERPALIVISGKGADEVQTLLHGLDVSDFLAKPFSRLDAVEQTIQRALAAR